jgi:hypothetical protein
MRGVVTAVDPATRTNRTAKMTVSFDQVTVNGRAYPIRGTVTQAIQGEGIKGETGRIATGAGVGAVLGGILGGVKGAILGTIIGGGGITAATEGKEVTCRRGRCCASGSIRRFRSRPPDSGGNLFSVRTGILVVRIPVCFLRFPQRNTQVLPLLAAKGLRQKDELPDVVADVRERAMQRLVYRERLSADRDRLLQVVVGQRL